MELRPRQAWALAEMYEAGGGIGILGPGEGKTLLSLLLPRIMGWERPVLFVPAALRDKTVRIDYPHLARHWHLLPLADGVSSTGHALGTPTLEVRSYEELSRESFADYLARRRVPDGIICDEVHYLKNRGSARTKRLLRYFQEFQQTQFAGFSGSLVHRSVLDYGHLTILALKDGAPLPHSFIELKAWADALDEGLPEYARPDAGALRDFCAPGEEIRDGYRRRLLETHAVISSPDLSTSIGLGVRELLVPSAPPDVVKAFTRLRNTAELPGGELCSTALDQTRHARELFLGFYLRWVWPNGQKDQEWLDKRRRWRAFVRKTTSRSQRGRWYDTEAQVATAVTRGEISSQYFDENTGQTYDAYADWAAVRNDRRSRWGALEPPKEVVWISDYMVVELERWAKENRGIVWIENVGFLEKLRQRGNVCYGAGENEIELEDGSRSVFASYAHTTGKNLQAWSRMCFANPLSSGKAWEQALGRQHRPNQLADEVLADVYLGCRETWWSFERSRVDARYIEGTLGQKQRLNQATLVVQTDEAVALARCDAGDPLWALTGHARLDTMPGVNTMSGGEGLTALREQAQAASAATSELEDDDIDVE